MKISVFLSSGTEATTGRLRRLAALCALLAIPLVGCDLRGFEPSDGGPVTSVSDEGIAAAIEALESSYGGEVVLPAQRPPELVAVFAYTTADDSYELVFQQGFANVVLCASEARHFGEDSCTQEAAHLLREAHVGMTAIRVVLLALDDAEKDKQEQARDGSPDIVNPTGPELQRFWESVPLIRADVDWLEK